MHIHDDTVQLNKGQNIIHGNREVFAYFPIPVVKNWEVSIESAKLLLMLLLELSLEKEPVMAERPF